MKRALLLLLPAVLLVFLSIGGCKDETEPRFSRIRVYPECGVAPLSVDGLAIASGGNESGSPTGGNNNLDISWNFGDGTSGGSTSVAYHTFTDPGTYNVVATATDPDGKTATISQFVRVMADTLVIEASSSAGDLAVTPVDTVQFNMFASSCDIDSTIDDDYRNLIFRWEMNDGTDTVFTTRRPRYQFPNAGNFDVTLTVTYPALSTTRRETVSVEVVDP